MEAVPRLPMISFDLKLSPERATFGPKLKQYIADAYNEDPESYANEIRQLEALRRSAVPPTIDVTGVQILKRYFCQLHFLQSRFPMGKGDVAAVTFSWRDIYASMVCSLADIKFELVSILYNIGALHTQLGAMDSRTTSDGMKMTCTHFQCAAWAFQHLRQNYPQPAGVDLAPEVMQYMHQLCLAQAQECILEKSMLDNRKATIIAKVAVQVVDYYNQALNTLNMGGDEGSIAETVGSKIFKEWTKYLKFKIAYHTCISLLHQGQQAEEQQKMGERVAFYHAASQELENARKLSKGLDKNDAIMEAIAFTMDVVEGKKKAATNENEFIYHEEVPERDTLQLVKGASLVKGIPFNFNDIEVSGPDIFARLVPMQAHEASSIYSEEKAQLLRKITQQCEEKDHTLIGFVQSLQLETIEQAAQIIINGAKMTDLPQEVVDRAAQLNANADAITHLVQAMATLANLYHDVESMLDEIQQYFNEEEHREQEYQTAVGTRPPSMVATELKREAGKYREAHTKANESNQTLHRAMTLHVNNLKLLQLPLDELRQHIPTLKMPDPNVNVDAVKELHKLINKIDEMRKQRVTLLAELRESITKDDVTEHIVTKPSDQPLDALFEQEMQKHQHVVKLIEQNLVAQDNIMLAMTDAYARHSNTRKTIIDLLKQRETTIHALSSSYDAYEDLLSKANKGIDFYKKLETNVSKLLQRVKSTCKVQSEERETILAKNKPTVPITTESVAASTTIGGGGGSTITPSGGGGYKLKDYLASMKRGGSIDTTTPTPYPYNYPIPPDVQQPTVVIPSVRPAPVGSEGTNEIMTKIDDKTTYPPNYYYPTQTTTDPSKKSLEERMAALMSKSNTYYQNYTQYPAAPGATTYYGANYSTPQPYNQYEPNISTQITTPTNYSVTSASTGGGTNSQIVVAVSDAQQYNSLAATSQPYPISSQQYAPPVTSQSQYALPPMSQYSTNMPQLPNDSQQAYATPQQYQSNYPTGNQSQYPNNYPVVTSTNQAQYLTNYNIVTPTNQSPYPSNFPTSTNQTQYNYPTVTSANQYPNNIVKSANQYPSAYPAGTSTNQIQYPTNYPTVTSANPTQYPPTATNQTQYPVNYSTDTSINQTQYPVSYPTATSANQIPYSANHPIVTSPISYPTGTPANQTQYTANYPTNQIQYPANYPTGTPSNQTQYSETYPTVTTANQTQYPASYPVVTSANQTQYPMSYPTITSTNQTQYPASYPIVTSANQTQYPASYPTATTANQTQYPASYPTVTSANQTQYPASYPTVTSANQTQYPVSYPVVTSANQTQYPANYSATTQYSNVSYPANNIQGQYYYQQNYTHPGYGYDPTTGQYVYSSGFQNTNITDPQQPSTSTVATPAAIITATLQMNYPTTPGQIYANAGSYNTTQTPSEQYTTTSTDTNGTTGTNYYSPPYGQTYLNNGTQQPQNPMTYMNSNTSNLNNTVAVTTVVTSAQEENNLPSTTNKQESNIDLLADIDFNIPYTPLTPQSKYTVIEQKKLDQQQSSQNIGNNTTSYVDTKTEQILSSTAIKKEETKSLIPLKDPLTDSEILNQFTQEVEKFEKFVENLTNKTLNGPTPLDLKWKELQDLQDKDGLQLNISVARCYPIKNRYPDILPFDYSRVELPSTKDDYINASHVKNITPYTPSFIMTQAPLQTTLSDFWTMIWEQQCEIIVCLLNDAELQDIYFPREKGEDLIFGRFRCSLESYNVKTHSIERTITLCMLETKMTRVIIHLQFISWPGISFPASPGPFLSFVCEVLTFHNHQRSKDHPLVVHCDSGIGRSGLFCLLTAYIIQPAPLPDIVKLVARISQNRKQSLRDREHLKFAYQAVLYHAQDLLMKRGILTSRSSFEESIIKKTHTRHPSQDLLLGPQNIERPNSQASSSNEYSSKRRDSNISQASSLSGRSSPTDFNKKGKLKDLKSTSLDPLSSLDPLWNLRQTEQQ